MATRSTGCSPLSLAPLHTDARTLPSECDRLSAEPDLPKFFLFIYAAKPKTASFIRSDIVERISSFAEFRHYAESRS